MLGKWDSFYRETQEPFSFGEKTSYVKAISFLEDGCESIQDWGCGAAFARTLVTKAKYVGLDGSWSRMADVVTDLREFKSSVDGILMRHVLEHNYDWKKVLENAISSFRKKFALIIFIPFSATETKQIAMNEQIGVPDIAFRKEDLMGLFTPFQVMEETLRTDTQYCWEHIFYISK